MSRRKTKGERELVADINDKIVIFCNRQGRCTECPLKKIVDEMKVDCPVAYIIYLMEMMNDEDEN